MVHSRPMGCRPGTASRPSPPTTSPVTAVLMIHQRATPISGRTTNSTTSSPSTNKITSRYDSPPSPPTPGPWRCSQAAAWRRSPSRRHSQVSSSPRSGAEAMRPAIPLTTGATRPEPVTVLVYSENPAVRERIRFALGGRPSRELGRVEYVEVDTGEGAVAAVDAGGIDLCILDGESWPTGGMGVSRQLKNEVANLSL